LYAENVFTQAHTIWKTTCAVKVTVVAWSHSWVVPNTKNQLTSTLCRWVHIQNCGSKQLVNQHVAKGIISFFTTQTQHRTENQLFYSHTYSINYNVNYLVTRGIISNHIKNPVWPINLFAKWSQAHLSTVILSKYPTNPRWILILSDLERYHIRTLRHYFSLREPSGRLVV
jgi:hypothetical protein